MADMHMNDLLPGDIMMGPIGGVAGIGVRCGQFILGEGFRVGQLAIAHCGVVVESGPAPLLVQAMPTGAEMVPLRAEHWTPRYAYFRLDVHRGTREDIAQYARNMIGIPYSPLSYLALAMWKFGADWPGLIRWIGRRDEHGYPLEAICSVLVDQTLMMAGIHLFTDGRPQQCVTPAGLAGRLIAMPEARLILPGVDH